MKLKTGNIQSHVRIEIPGPSSAPLGKFHNVRRLPPVLRLFAGQLRTLSHLLVSNCYSSCGHWINRIPGWVRVVVVDVVVAVAVVAAEIYRKGCDGLGLL